MLRLKKQQHRTETTKTIDTCNDTIMTRGRLRPGRFIRLFGRVFSDRAGPGFRPDHIYVVRTASGNIVIQ